MVLTLSFTLALSGTFVTGDEVPDPVTRPCVRQLFIAETRLAEVKYLPQTCARESPLFDTKPASQGMAENPDVRFVGICTGRVGCKGSTSLQQDQVIDLREYCP